MDGSSLGVGSQVVVRKFCESSEKRVEEGEGLGARGRRCHGDSEERAEEGS